MKTSIVNTSLIFGLTEVFGFKVQKETNELEPLHVLRSLKSNAMFPLFPDIKLLFTNCEQSDFPGRKSSS